MNLKYWQKVLYEAARELMPRVRAQPYPAARRS
jgi:hypothetical protein